MSDKIEKVINDSTVHKAVSRRKTTAIYISNVLYDEYKQIQSLKRNDGEKISLGQIAYKQFEDSQELQRQNAQMDLLREDIKVLQEENQKLTQLLIKNTTNPVSSDSLIKEITKLMEVMLKTPRSVPVYSHSPVLTPPPPPIPPKPNLQAMDAITEKNIDIKRINDLALSIEKTLEDENQPQYQVDKEMKKYLKEELDIVVNTNHSIKPSKVFKKIHKNSKLEIESVEDYNKRKEIRKKNKKPVIFDKNFKFYAELHPDKFESI